MTEDEDYDALSQKHLASIKRDMRVSLEDAAVRATHKVMAEFEVLTRPEQQAVFDCPRCGHVCSQRPWVGLTDGDWGWVADRKGTSLDSFEQGATWAQARLQERNK